MQFSRRALLSLLTICFSSLAQLLHYPAQAETYQLPPAAMQAIVDAPRAPQVFLSPQRSLAAFVNIPSLPSIAQVAQAELKLAGIRIHPRNYSASKYQFGSDLYLLDLQNQQEIRINGLPPKLALAELAWSPDQRYLAFSHVQAEGVEMWVVDIAKRQAKRASPYFLNAVLSRGFEWLPNSQQLLLTLRPPKASPLPSKNEVPKGPLVQTSQADGQQRHIATYQDLLKNQQDEQSFEHYITSQLALQDLGGNTRMLGTPERLAKVQVAPNGQFLLLTTLPRPYSYLVPHTYFAQQFEIRDMQGKVVHLLGKRALQEGLPPGDDAVVSGIRQPSWRADAPASVVWVEAQDGGDAKRPANVRDAVLMLAAPFQGKPVTLAQLSLRLRDLHWGRGDLALVSEGWRQTRQQKVWRIAPDQPGSAPSLVFDYSSEDRYQAPGRFVMRTNASGQQLLHLGSGALSESILLANEGASAEGDRPFLERYDLRSKQRQKLFHSTPPYYENLVAVLNDDASRLLLTREQPSERPNYFLRSVQDNQLSLQQLTHFPHPYPQLQGVQKEQIRYQRQDGVALTATLYLPAGYEAKRDGPLPLLMWAYPREFKSGNAASQVKGSPYRFNAISFSGPLPFLTQGYAVLDDPLMPIVGEAGQEPNDSYLPQLISSAQAAIDEVVKRGVAERNRIAIGGHSYGAFMTANLLSHTRLFKAGIARSGAYNRSLTPFGFQSENRSFWQARQVYHAMSPFEYADRMDDALLIIHGEQDNNPGTYPMQSERLFQALRGLGKTTRLVMLPNESHGYRARESVLHVLAESHAWLEKYLKGAKLDGGVKKD